MAGRRGKGNKEEAYEQGCGPISLVPRPFISENSAEKWICAPTGRIFYRPGLRRAQLKQRLECWLPCALGSIQWWGHSGEELLLRAAVRTDTWDIKETSRIRQGRIWTSEQCRVSVDPMESLEQSWDEMLSGKGCTFAGADPSTRRDAQLPTFQEAGGSRCFSPEGRIGLSCHSILNIELDREPKVLSRREPLTAGMLVRSFLILILTHSKNAVVLPGV